MVTSSAEAIGATGTDLGELTRLDARSVWQNEAADFTPWLRDNIHLLGQALGLEIDDDVQSEVAVGLFSADLLGSEAGSSASILIENQLEETNHRHLGQLLTYAGGLDSDILIWVSPRFRDEHRQALTWLNERTPEDVRIFGVEIELLRIDDSRPAPHFKVVVAPNKWQKAGTEGVSTERSKRYRAFFRDFLERLLERDPHATSASPESVGREPWLSIPLGRSGIHGAFNFGWAGSLPVARVNVYIRTPDKFKNEAYFDQLYADRNAIEDEFGEPLTWDRRDDITRCHIYISRSASIDDPPEALEGLRDWGVERLLKLRDVFAPRVQQL